jgi:pyruvate dehydrogenase E1 component beta subunit
VTRELTYADALNEALAGEMTRDERVYLIGEDIGAGMPFGVTRGLRERFGPDRVLDAPISEAAIVGSAVGAALTGLRPVVDMHFADFVTCAMDEVVNQLAKSRYMFGGQGRFPLTLRMPYGIGKSAGGHHSNSVEAWFLNTPGLKLCIPSNPADAKGLLATAIRDEDPVLVFEPRGLYWMTGAVPDGAHLVPLGLAAVVRPGRDVTLIATGRMVHLALEAADLLEADGVAAEVVDPRSLVPLDRDTLLRSVAHTHRVVIVEEGPLRGGVGGHLAWVVMEGVFDELDAPIARVAGCNVPVPFAPVLEAAVSPQVGSIVTAARRTLGITA